MALVSGSSAVLEEGVSTPRRKGRVTGGFLLGGGSALFTVWAKAAAIPAILVEIVDISVNTMGARTPDRP